MNSRLPTAEDLTKLQTFAFVSVAALTVGACVGYASASPASNFVSTTQPTLVASKAVPAFLKTSSPRLPVRQAVSIGEYQTRSLEAEGGPQLIAGSTKNTVIAAGALIVAGFASLLSATSKIQQKARPLADLTSAWTMASAGEQPNLGAGKTVRVATRKSPLAMWQAEFVQSELMRLWPGITVELMPMSTKGDKILDSPLAKVGGKGLFVKELETALLEGRADIAVHSTKDVPMELPEGLALSIILKRHDPYDAIVFPKGSSLKSLDDLPQGARVGTSSLRRQTQLRLKRPDLKFLELRGNVNTRLAKLDSGDYDAIILAAAGLKRMGFLDRVLPGETNIIDPVSMLPAAGQGAMSIEVRAADTDVLALLQPLHHIPDALTVNCERAMNRRLAGGCQVPISGFATLGAGQLRMEGRVGSVSGQGPLIIKHRTIPFDMAGAWPQLNGAAEALGVAVAEDLLGAGAQAYLDEAYATADVGVGLRAQQQAQ